MSHKRNRIPTSIAQGGVRSRPTDDIADPHDITIETVGLGINTHNSSVSSSNSSDHSFGRRRAFNPTRARLKGVIETAIERDRASIRRNDPHGPENASSPPR